MITKFVLNDPTKGVNQQSKWPNLDSEVMILSTHRDLNEGRAVGLYVPSMDPVNRFQTRIFEKTKSGIVLKHAEDRRMGMRFLYQNKVLGEEHPEYQGFQRLDAMWELSGLLSPRTAKEYYGDKHFEAIVRRSYVLFGTPAEIFSAIEERASKFRYED